MEALIAEWGPKVGAALVALAPGVLAVDRRVPGRWRAFGLKLFLGWTIVGGITAWVWAICGRVPAHDLWPFWWLALSVQVVTGTVIWSTGDRRFIDLDWARSYHVFIQPAGLGG